MLLALCPVSAHAEGQTIVHAGTVEELRSALADNTKIVLEGTDYSIGYLGVDGLDNAQPGDIICYSGHVGIYIGNGQIVHASNERTGITVSNANYRNILAIRRIF